MITTKPNRRWRFLGVMLVVTSAASDGTVRAAPMDHKNRSCAVEAVERSICVLEALLTDVRSHYKPRGGGGIASIVQKATGHYQVQIPQEGRVDLIDYEVAVSADGKVRITGRKDSSSSRP